MPVVLALSLGAIRLRAAQEAKLTASDGTSGNLFARAVALEGDTAIIGAPERLQLVPVNPTCFELSQADFATAHVFVRSNGVWSRQAKLQVTGIYTQFGTAVALSGNTAVVGAPGIDAISCSPAHVGAAYVFVRSGSTWTTQASIFSPGSDLSRFGQSVAIAGDTLVVGAPSGTYVYTRAATIWTLQATLPMAGSQVAIDGTTIVISSGSATQIYVLSSGTWVLQATLGVGGPVSISVETLLVAGTVWVRSSGRWTQQAALVGSVAVAIKGDTAIFGNPETAYVYQRIGTAWSLRATLAASDAAANDKYGIGVATNGDTCIVGASDATIGSNVLQGAAYVYTSLSPPLTVGLTADRQSPQTTGSTTTFTATSSGGPGSQFKWWMSTNGGMTYTVAREWDSAPTYAWTPVAASNYVWVVWARSAGSTSDMYQGATSMPFVIQAAPAITSLTLTADRPSPQRTLTPITLTATAGGGVAPAQFQWWFFNGFTWSMARDWSTAPIYVWTPSVARSNYYWAVYGRSAGSLATPFERVSSMSFVIQRPPGLALKADFDDSGMSDVLWRDSATGATTVWLMNGVNAPMSASTLAVPDTNWEVKATHDFDGDGKSDVLWRNKMTGGNVIWYMNGSTIAASGPIMPMSDVNFAIRGVGDFNGDGRADILWRHTITGENRIWLMDGPTVLQDAAILTVSDTNWEILGVADFDGDGKADLFWRHKTTGETALWLMSGTSLAGAGALYTVSDLRWEIKGVGDFNGDGRADVLWRNTATGDNSLWLLNGLTVTGGVYLLPVTDLNWEIRGTGDFDGDGMADILWRQKTTGLNSVWLMNGAGLRTGAYLPPMPLTADPVGPGR